MIRQCVFLASASIWPIQVGPGRRCPRHGWQARGQSRLMGSRTPTAARLFGIEPGPGSKQARRALRAGGLRWAERADPRVMCFSDRHRGPTGDLLTSAPSGLTCLCYHKTKGTAIGRTPCHPSESVLGCRPIAGMKSTCSRSPREYNSPVCWRRQTMGSSRP